MDAALPFLSFGAGLMTAADILKLSIADYPFTPNNVSFATRPIPRLSTFRLPQRENCICRDRNESVYWKILEGSKYTGFSSNTVNA